ncbi:hypothetical protein [Flavobacterium sp.]|jgi:hypothetical protein|uniref:hypothetical protein n=1 Tax=Flavobacterium sp. TaxID=239 RepID=UPI0037C0DA8B
MVAEYNKEMLLIDIDTIVETFRALVYATRVTFDSQKELGLPIDKIDVDAKGTSDSCIIRGTEFSCYLNSPEKLEALINHCAAFSRANLLIAIQERIKGYCLNSTQNNKTQFLETKDDFKHRSALYMLKCLRDSATHWKPANEVFYSDKYGDELEIDGLIIKQKMLESNLNVSNFKLLELVGKVRKFVVEELN